MSKGSKARPYNVTQYGDNFDGIFSKKTDDSIHKDQSEVMMGAIRQSNEQRLDKEVEDMFYAGDIGAPYPSDDEQ